jgi:hypothetical protein
MDSEISLAVPFLHPPKIKVLAQPATKNKGTPSKPIIILSYNEFKRGNGKNPTFLKVRNGYGNHHRKNSVLLNSINSPDRTENFITKA